MKCPDCGTETRHAGTSQTLVGYHSPEGHDHDDNCEKRYYRCKACGGEWIESRRRSCPKAGCEWQGKVTCRCHAGPKVAEWSDPEDYYTEEIQAYLRQRDP